MRRLSRTNVKHPDSFCLRCRLDECDEKNSRCLYRVAERLEAARKQRDRLHSTIQYLKDHLYGADRTEYFAEYYKNNRERKLKAASERQKRKLEGNNNDRENHNSVEAVRSEGDQANH